MNDSAELTVEQALDKIKQQNSSINAFLEVFEDAQNNHKGVLSGKPFAIKDNLVITKNKTTAASRILEDFEAPYTATVVEKIIQAGGVIVGKTNLDEFACGSSTENSAFGSVKNPVDTSRVPGGSSGGSAAAVAAGMVWGALGSDTGGSIRQPAAFCGVVGFKPTYGTVSRYGLMAMGSSLDVIGPFASNVADAKLIYDVISGADPKDATSRNPQPVSHQPSAISQLTYGIPKEFFGEGLDPRIKSAIDETIQKLRSQGSTIKEISLPTAPASLAVYYIIMPVELASNLARYDGIKYGYSIEKTGKAESLLDVYLKSRSKGFGAEIKRRLMLGTYASSAGYVDQYYNQAQKVRQEIKNEFEETFKSVDLILTPVTPQLPFKFGEKSDDPLKMYLEDIYTVPANIAGVPALSLPIGKATDQGSELPIGLQIIGRELEDYKVLSAGQLIEDLK